MDQAADARDHEEHDRRELVHLEGEVHLQALHGKPGPELDDDRLVRRVSEQLEEDADADREGAEQDPGPHYRHGVPGLGPADGERTVDEEAAERKCDGEPDHVGEVHHPCSRLMFWRSTDCR